MSIYRGSGLLAHLSERGVQTGHPGMMVVPDSGIVYFWMYNLTGQLVGYVRYDPSGDKTGRNTEDMGRYYIYASSGQIPMWGIESITPDARVVFITEGIFDAIKIQNAGHAAVAALTNHPKQIRTWLAGMSLTSIAIMDNDVAGKKLGSVTDLKFTVPDPYQDVGSMPQPEVNKFITNIMEQVWH